jgi:HK97 family phage portal protein
MVPNSMLSNQLIDQYGNPISSAAIGGGFERKSDAYDALLGIGLATAANIAVTPELALKCVPVYRGVSVRCEVLGSLPFLLYERREDGGKDRAINHPLYRLIHDRPNAWTSAADFVMQLELDCITDAGGFALANRSGEKIVELIRLAPRSVNCQFDDATLEPKYEVTLKNGSKRIYRWQDILHVPTLGGMSAIKQAREAIGLCMAMERHAGALFGNGARPSGVLKFKRKLDDAVYDRLVRSWGSGHNGENAGKTAILEDDADFTALTFNSVDLQFQELRGFQVVEIARALGVPPTLLMDFGRATWANTVDMSQAFLTYTELPRMKLWQGAVSRLLTAEEQAKFVPEFLVDELVKADIAARFEAYSKAIASRVLNPNEARAKENLAPYDGGNEFANPNIQTAADAPKPPVQPAKPRIVA